MYITDEQGLILFFCFPCYIVYMKISQNLPQFAGEHVLLVVTGRQEAEFYRAGDGEVEKVAAFKVETPKYSDREGHFKTRGRGMVLASGAVYEAQKEKILQDFRREFKSSLKSVLANFSQPDRIYMYTPAYMATDVQGLFPRLVAGAIKKTIRGNFYGRHPFELLEKI